MTPSVMAALAPGNAERGGLLSAVARVQVFARLNGCTVRGWLVVA